MEIDGSVITEQGLTFAIIIVKPYVIEHEREAALAHREFSRLFPGMPNILMVQGANGIPAYHGEQHIIALLNRCDPRSIPWKRYTFL